MFIYMKVSDDVYELPLAVAGSIPELAKMLNLTAGSVYTYFSRKQKQFIKVEIKDEKPM